MVPVNALQSVPYRINQRVLAVAQALRADIDVEDSPSQHSAHTLLRQVEAAHHKALGIPKDADDHKATWRTFYTLKKRLTKIVSQRLLAHRILDQADTMQSKSPFFFPMNCDFRGRVYPLLRVGLSPIGSDLAKALLLFHRGKPLLDVNNQAAMNTEDFWLAVYGASLFDEKDTSKHPAARFEWTRVHRKQILLCADDPITHRWWIAASKPWRFLAFCFEYAAAWRCPEGFWAYISHLPIAIDATCNGLQHFAMMLRDEQGAQAVNVALPSDWADEPADVYARVADRMKQTFLHEAHTNRFAREWLQLGFASQAKS